VVSYQLAYRDDKRNKYTLQFAVLIKFGSYFGNIPRPIYSINSKEYEYYLKAHANFSQMLFEIHDLFPESRELAKQFVVDLFILINGVDHYMTLKNTYGDDHPVSQKKINELLEQYEKIVEPDFLKVTSSMRMEME
jgi:hypothetical protein